MIRLPYWFVYAVVLICISPIILNIAGIDFSNKVNVLDILQLKTLTVDELKEKILINMAGNFTHSILEWSAFMCAILSVLLAFTNYRITVNSTVLVLSVALFFSGVMDAFHTLAADRLIESTAANSDFIPFTWAISRLFNALILLVGASIFIFMPTNFKIGLTAVNKKSVNLVSAICIIIGGLAFIIIQISATSKLLPQTQFPDNLITRPYDLWPAFIYAIGSIAVFKLNRLYPSVFSHALLISMVPQIMTQLHMAFGSSQLFDSHFNIAHFLKIFAYFIPFAGLCFDYHNKQLSLKKEICAREQAQKELKHAYDDLEQLVIHRTEDLSNTQELYIKQNKLLQEKTQQLESSNDELEQFAFIASHDLKEPLRKISTFGGRLMEKYASQLPEKGQHYVNRMIASSKRMDNLIHDLLGYSRVKSQGESFKPVNLYKVAIETKEFFDVRIEESGALIEIDKLTVIDADLVQIRQVFQNLIGNALKYCRENIPPVIRVVSKVDEHSCIISFEDNGQGFDTDQAKRIFQPFQRLHGRAIEGTGMGLAIVKKIIERHQGKIKAESVKGKGSKFLIELPLRHAKAENI